MKKVILSAAVIAVLGLVSCKDETKKAESTQTEVSNEIALTELSFGVRGNCGMCKNTIEKAVNAVEGVAKADWDVNKKKIDVAFDGSKTDAMTIHKSIAASGYDTDKVAGSEDAYKNLPGCCQYDHTMEMNQSGENQADTHGEHHM